VLELLEDIQELRPTIFSSVPRLWNRIYDKVMAQVGGLSWNRGGWWRLYW
jgi:long-subunit acyl-CoA synthetase (AMP-forming)